MSLRSAIALILLRSQPNLIFLKDSRPPSNTLRESDKDEQRYDNAKKRMSRDGFKLHVPRKRLGVIAVHLAGLLQFGNELLDARVVGFRIQVYDQSVDHICNRLSRYQCSGFVEPAGEV